MKNITLLTALCLHTAHRMQPDAWPCNLIDLAQDLAIKACLRTCDEPDGQLAIVPFIDYEGPPIPDIEDEEEEPPDDIDDGEDF